MRALISLVVCGGILAQAMAYATADEGFTGSITLIVLDRHARPVSDATVVLYEHERDVYNRLPVSRVGPLKGATGPEGLTAFKDLPRASYCARVWAGKRGGWKEHIHVDETRPDVEVSMRADLYTSVRGLVTDAWGEPVEAVQIHKSAPAGTEWIPVTCSDEDGRFEIANLNFGIGAQSFTFTKSGLATVRAGLMPHHRQVRIIMFPGARANLVVTDSTAAPVPGALVWVRDHVGRTDSRGEWLTPWFAASNELSVNATRRTPLADWKGGHRMPVEPGEHVIPIQLRTVKEWDPATLVTGRVVLRGTQEPVRAWVSGGPSGAKPSWERPTDRHGCFALERMPLGESICIEVRPESPVLCQPDGPLRLTLEPAGLVRDMVVEVAPGAAIRGMVLDNTGTPFRPGKVYAMPRDSGGEAAWEWSDEKGRFELKHLNRPGHPYLVYATYQGHRAELRIDAPAPGQTRDDARLAFTDVAYKAPVEGIVRGTVHDTEGRPVSGVHLRLDGVQGGAGLLSQDDGYFEIHYKGAGQAELSARYFNSTCVNDVDSGNVGGACVVSPSSIDLPAGAVIDDFHVEVDPLHLVTLVGYVTDHEGLPVEASPQCTGENFGSTMTCKRGIYAHSLGAGAPVSLEIAGRTLRPGSDFEFDEPHHVVSRGGGLPR